MAQRGNGPRHRDRELLLAFDYRLIGFVQRGMLKEIGTIDENEYNQSRRHKTPRCSATFLPAGLYKLPKQDCPEHDSQNHHRELRQQRRSRAHRKPDEAWKTAL